LKPFFQQREKLIAAFDENAARAQHQEAVTKWEAAVAAANAAGKPPPARPGDPVASHVGVMNLGGLFNGMIAPLVPYALRGMVWYQGESNAHPDRARFYEAQLRLLVTDWRARWAEELPFVWVQLPNLAKKMPWPEIREAQLRCLDLPQTGMTITIDVGDPRDVHPKDKQTVGHRLAQWALGSVYHADVPAVSGPIVEAHEIRGHEMVVRFRHANGGLLAKDGPLVGFVIAGENRAWKPAEARIEGNSVVVSSPKVPQPVAVRYAWMPNPTCNLFNGAGLPASPFRTDDWESAPPP
jgi:sialate O-acetylesterase